jgi:hypothetical protein
VSTVHEDRDDGTSQEFQAWLTAKMAAVAADPWPLCEAIARANAVAQRRASVVPREAREPQQDSIQSGQCDDRALRVS